ncbi:unnamed protein product [Cunninghamella blakesleeana]
MSSTNDNHGKWSCVSNHHSISPLLTNLWNNFITHVHRDRLKMDDILKILSYCFNISSTMTGETRIIFESFKAAKLVLPINDNDEYKINHLSSSFYVNGFLVGFSSCYAASCRPGLSTCYTPTCPNKLYTQWLHIYNHVSKMEEKTWTEHVPKHILNTYPMREIKRQSAIAELIQSEIDYCKDLTILEEIYAIPFLKSQQIINQRQQNKFYAIVFESTLKLTKYHQQLCYQLVNHRQDTSLLFVDFVGNALLKHNSLLVDIYLTHANIHVEALHILNKEMDKNSSFKTFIEHQNEHPLTRKLDIHHYLTRPTLRLPKYKLQLETIAKYTDHMADQVALAAAIDTIHDLLNRMNDTIKRAEKRIQLLSMTSSISSSSLLLNTTHLHYHLQQATLIHHDRLQLSRVTSHSLRVQMCYVFLFSHALLITKPKGPPGNETFELIGRPIPLPMLSVTIQPNNLIIRRLSIKKQQKKSDLRHRFSLISNISSSESTESSSSSSSSSPSFETTSTLSPTTFSTTNTFSEIQTQLDQSLPSSSSSPLQQKQSPPPRIYLKSPDHYKQPNLGWKTSIVRPSSPTVTGLHVRARFFQAWNDIKKFQHHKKTFPTLEKMDKEKATSQQQKRTNSSSSSFFKRSSSLLLDRQSILYSSPLSLLTNTVSSSPTSPPHSSFTLFHSPSSSSTSSSSQQQQQSPTIKKYGQTRLTIKHLAYPEYHFDLRCQHHQQRDQWVECIQKALNDSSMKMIMKLPDLKKKNHPPFKLNMICDVPVGSNHSIDVNGDKKLLTGCGRIHCTLPFETSKGHHMIALGTQYGLWLASKEDSEFQLLDMIECHQLDIINNNIIIARSHRTLKAYTLDENYLSRLNNNNNNNINDNNHEEDDHLSTTYPYHSSLPPPSSTSPSSFLSSSTTKSHFSTTFNCTTIKKSKVIYFKIGTLYQKSVLCYLTKTIKHSLLKHHTSHYYLTILSLKSLQQQQQHYPYFKKEKTILLQLEDAVSFDIYNNQIYIRSLYHGIECVDVKTNHSIILNMNQQQHSTTTTSPTFSSIFSPILNDRPLQSSHPCNKYDIDNDNNNDNNQLHWIGCLHIPKDINYQSSSLALLCNRQQAYMVNMSTMTLFPEKEFSIPFESNVKSIAMIYPYLILFSTNVIEIRHIENSELVQVIPGQHIRCIYLSSSQQDTSPIIHFTMLKQTDHHILSVYQLVQ